MSIIADSVIGVLVAYQPDDAVVKRIKSHLHQLSRLIVIDNGANKVSESLPNLKGLTLLSHSNNNLAAAQNLGIRSAREQGAKAVLLLDDDSDLGEAMLQALCDAYTPRCGLVAPQVFVNDVAQAQACPWMRFLFRRHSAPIDCCYTPIASGSLIAMKVFEQVGLMDESFNIDYVDREFCLRLMQRGYAPKVIAEAVLYHQLGQSERRPAGILVRHHTAARRRTIFRNRLRCWARYGVNIPSFLLYDIAAAGYDVLRIVAFESKKADKLKAIMQGVCDAIFRR